MISGMIVRGETKLLGKTFSSALEIKQLEGDHLRIYKHLPVKSRQ
jgi:hypothetical protein